MKRKYYIAADGGGSKLQAVLYDDQFQIKRSFRTSGVNGLFKPKDEVRENLCAMLRELIGDDVDEIESFDYCLICDQLLIDEVLAQEKRIKHAKRHGEPHMALGAALEYEGAVALSGTGSDAFMISDGKFLGAVGGWGPLLGDEGSGYDIGLRAIKAAIYAQDGRGVPTVLQTLVVEHWHCNRLWDIVHILAGNPDARHEVASAARLASRAANAGDAVAISIYEHAADEQVLMMDTLIKRFFDAWNGKIVLIGGAWKGSAHMVERFTDEITRRYPNARVTPPIFEPVVGCVVCRCLEEGRAIEEIREPLLRGFAELLYKS